MNRKKILQYRMLTRVVDFGAKHVGLFPEHTIAGDVLAEIGSTVTQLTEYATSRVSSHTSILMSGQTRRQARLTVKRQMELTAQIGRALKLADFSIPRDPKEEDLISTARSFVERMEPLKTEFSQHGLPPEKLKTSIQVLEESLLGLANGQSTRSGAIREFSKLLDVALNLVERLDAIIENTLADDELVMAAWKVARQIDRPAHSAKPEPKPEPKPAVEEPTHPAAVVPADEEAATATA
jgi:hypothetical protein